jgi:hypothetical protein
VYVAAHGKSVALTVAHPRLHDGLHQLIVLAW